MRTMMRITIPVEGGNRALKDGTLPKVLEATLSELKPEATFFTTVDGERTCYVVFDLKEPSVMPSISEPLFSALNAKVQFSPAMNREDLKAGLERMARQR